MQGWPPCGRSGTSPGLDGARGAGSSSLDEERAASLEFFQLPSPAALRKLRQDAARAPPGLARAELHLKVATATDATLRKDEAFGAILLAMEALQGAREPTPPEHLGTVRAILRHALAANVEVTERWLAELGSKHPGSPLYAAMRGALGVRGEGDGEEERVLVGVVSSSRTRSRTRMRKA